MRKLILALFTCLSFIVFTSCTTEDIDDTSTILGEWTLTSWTVDAPIDLNNDGTPQSEFSPGCLTDSTINFMDVSNATVFFSSEVTYNTRMENGKVIFMTSCSTDSDRMPTLGEYTINNNSVMIDLEGEAMVLTLSGNTLTMTVPNGFIAKDIDTFETTVMQDITYIFTR
ncbi:MAG: lipocalin family protein [Flavobacteriaceae bacterium]|nr:lipocalin family protein [Flavobacteriaceae bacterium]